MSSILGTSISFKAKMYKIIIAMAQRSISTHLELNALTGFM
jgi:hypothetical protein